MAATIFTRRPFWVALVIAALVVVTLSTSAGRELAQRWLGSLRIQKVQAVNVDLSPFVNASTNPALHQMVSQMISDKVNVTLNEANQPASDRAAATALAGFPVQLIDARKDAPKLVVGGRHELNMTVDRSRLQEILKAAGHPEIAVPASLNGASFSVKIPRALHAQYGTCPGRVTATNALASQVIETSPSAGQYADCVRLTEGPSPVVNVPAGLDVQKLAEIGLEVAGMSTGPGGSFLSGGRLEVDADFVRAALAAFLRAGKGGWRARHASHAGRPARTGIHADLGQERNGLFAWRASETPARPWRWRIR